MSRAILSALCVLAWWAMPYMSVVTTLFENLVHVFQQAKYILPIFVCLLFFCQKKTLNDADEYFPFKSVITSAFSESSPRSWRSLPTPAQGDTQWLGASQNWRCAKCGNTLTSNYKVDYIIPLSYGGSNSVENLQALCPKC